MGKFATNPNVMTDIGATPVSTNMDLLQQRRAETGQTTAPSAAEQSSTGQSSGCIAYTPKAWLNLQNQGWTLSTDPATGKQLMCPPGASPAPLQPKHPLAGPENTLGGTTTPMSTEGGLGEFSWPTELNDFYQQLIARGSDLLNAPLGFDPKALSYMFGTNFENVRDQEAASRNAMYDTMSRQGMLGSGSATKQLNNLSWNTENTIADLMRDIYIQNEQQKKQDLLNTSGMANSLFGSGMGYSQAEEAMNAARRGEGNQALMLLLSLLNLYKG